MRKLVVSLRHPEKVFRIFPLLRCCLVDFQCLVQAVGVIKARRKALFIHTYWFESNAFKSIAIGCRIIVLLLTSSSSVLHIQIRTCI